MMKTIETHVTVAPDGKIGIPSQMSSDLAPGEHRALLVIQEDVKTATAGSKSPLRLHILDEEPPVNTSLRREDIYGDDGR
ncbi:MAG TPA: hypothetical protein VMW27_15570 [Thermoanaerobaculia bacterium]|nr:hypothetical protein [Thermoanaerobaculia bacterium]